MLTALSEKSHLLAGPHGFAATVRSRETPQIKINPIASQFLLTHPTGLDLVRGDFSIFYDLPGKLASCIVKRPWTLLKQFYVLIF